MGVWGVQLPRSVKGARGFLKPFKHKSINRMRLLHNFPCSYAFSIFVYGGHCFVHKDNAKEKESCLLLATPDSMHSHVDSPRVSLDRALDAFAHVDSLRVSVNATQFA